MKIFNNTGIFADNVEPAQDAPGVPESVETSEQVSELERAQNALKRADEAIKAGKPEAEAKERSAYEWYAELLKCNPREAGIYWRANKEAIYACIEH